MTPEQTKKTGEEQQENAPVVRTADNHSYDEYEYFSDANDHWL